ncbi:MAG: adenine phosphoribosyltransferase, partial [Mycobacterium sp.]
MSDARREAATLIDTLTRNVADFPVAGVDFKDLTPVLADPRGLAMITDALAEAADGVDLIAGVDARGFLLGAAVALRMGTGVLAVRKGGKLPPPVHTVRYELEYGSATLEVPADGVDLTGRRVLVIDDVLATGGTLAAAAQLLGDAGA